MELIAGQGFTNVRVLGIGVPFKGITLTKSKGQHGSDQILSDTNMAEHFGDLMGFVFKAPG